MQFHVNYLYICLSCTWVIMSHHESWCSGMPDVLLQIFSDYFTCAVRTGGPVAATAKVDRCRQPTPLQMQCPNRRNSMELRGSRWFFVLKPSEAIWKPSESPVTEGMRGVSMLLLEKGPGTALQWELDAHINEVFVWIVVITCNHYHILSLYTSSVVI
jgi:hypothetical protein